MSSMLEQAIIDAEELREAARKNAEETIVEKYQKDIREAVEKILEQPETEELATFDVEEFGEEPGVLGVDEDGDLEFIEDLPSAQKSPDDEVVTIDLDKLEEMMEEEMEEEGLDASEMGDREEIAAELEGISEEDEIEVDEQELNELLDEVDLDDEVLEALIDEEMEEEVIEEVDEELEEVDEELSYKRNDDPKRKRKKKRKKEWGGEPGGYGGGGYYDYGARTKQLQENKSLLRDHKQLNQKAQLLEQKLNKYGTVITQLKNKLNESNLTNAKLLYQNRILNSISLNERQKDKIVEAISNTTSVEEAKIVFETLQSAVGGVAKRRGPESLNEVVTRSSSAFIPHKEETQKNSDSFAERMKTLAGLKNN